MLHLIGKPPMMMNAHLSEVKYVEVKFLKGTEEWTMFMEFWNLCQKYWIPESEDSWWDEALNEIDAFQKNNGSTVFARGLSMTLINHLEIMRLEQKQA